MGIFSISSGGKFRVRAGRVSFSNRGGVRVRVARGVTVGKTGVRLSARAGPLRASTGSTGTRAAIVGGTGPFYYGVNSSGAFAGIAGSTGSARNHHRGSSSSRRPASPTPLPSRDFMTMPPKAPKTYRAPYTPAANVASQDPRVLKMLRDMDR